MLNVYIGQNKDYIDLYLDRGISYYWLKQRQKVVANFAHANKLLPDGDYFSDYFPSTTLELYTVALLDLDKKLHAVKRLC